MSEQQLTFWQRLKRTRRISVTDDVSLRQIWSVRWNWFGVLMFFIVLFLVMLVAMSAIIIYTPARQLLPGYREDVRQQLVEQSARVDSLITDLQLQQQYVDMLKQVVAGDVESDSIQPLDSMQLVMREQLLVAKREATEEFIAQYEQKENDRFQLFDIQVAAPLYTLHRPAEGVIEEHYNAEQGHPYITILAGQDAILKAVLAGVIVFESYEMDNTYTLVVQHEQYISVYRHIAKINKHLGDELQEGEVIGWADGTTPIDFFLWHGGKSVNPEELIAF